MTYIFETIPLATDSRILYEKQCKIKKYDVRYEFWRVHGLLAECSSFDNDDVCDLDNEKLEKLIRDFVEIREGSAITITKSPESTFVIFNLV